jgi:hypothetical protein
VKGGELAFDLTLECAVRLEGACASRDRAVQPAARSGMAIGMEGGIGFFLLLIVVVVVVGGGVALYLTGGALWAKGSQSDDAPERRPTHKAPMPPEQEHTHFVGTPEGDEAARRQRGGR